MSSIAAASDTHPASKQFDKLALTQSELRTKYLTLATPVLGEAAAKRSYSLICDVVNAPDLAEIASALRTQ